MLDDALHDQISDSFLIWITSVNQWANIAAHLTPQIKECHSKFLPSVLSAVDTLKEARAVRASFMIVGNDNPTVIPRVQLAGPDGKFIVDPYDLLTSTLNRRFSKIRWSRSRYMIRDTPGLAKHLVPLVGHLYCGLQRNVDKLVSDALAGKESHAKIQAKLDVKREAAKQRELKEVKRAFAMSQHLVLEDVVTAWNEYIIEKVIST